MTVAEFRRLFAYQWWARDRQLTVIAALAPEDFTRPLRASFPSLRDHLVHIMEVESLWLQRAQGVTEPVRRKAAEFPTASSVQTRWTEVEAGVTALLDKLSDADLERIVTGQYTSGIPFLIPLGDLLLHASNHSTYHRGQVTTLLRQLGATPPAVDLTVFLTGNG